MTTDITELAQRMKAAAEKATPGEWWADEVKNEGCYGSGDDCVEGFASYAIYGSDGQTLFDSLNSDAACICEEYDGEEHVAWDEAAQRNAEFIALANPANILALVEALDKAQQLATQQGNIACALFDEVTAQRQHIAELEEAEQKLCAANVTLDARAELAERQLAELESRTVTVKPPEPYAYLRENDGQIQISIGAERPSDRSGGYATPWFAIYTAAGIKVEAE
ncbi:hypothetical protein SM90_00530 [Klebsiella pneumoniae]|uniref:ead/Ea22-like family protein n=1 Tax=Klebsiella pneumoniae TaxID=573 RepID=UPI00065955E8|nr:ead/Ea22-like family protein [Klebsiella pneumoniae]KMI46761.1 hypothetical protein SM90_00530 [Klebsiella pneumoniae]HBX7991432.1 hypothetical protein [Klebsiella pneumoniae]